MRLFNLDFQKRRGTFSIYEKFEHLIITLLTAIIVAATWQLILHTFALVRSHLLDPRDSQVFQTVFGMVLTVLIAMEFKHSLLVVLHHQRDIVQIRSLVLIALLAMVRKFIILDIYRTQPAVVFALAAASLSLGIVFWLVRNEDAPGSSTRCASETAANGDPATEPVLREAIHVESRRTTKTDKSLNPMKYTTMPKRTKPNQTFDNDATGFGAGLAPSSLNLMKVAASV